jgi:hypothetical protein
MQIQLTLPRPHSAQLAMLRESRATTWRRAGVGLGSTLAIELLSRPALEGQPVAYFSPTYKLLTEVWRYLESTLSPSFSARTQRSAGSNCSPAA